MAENVVTAPAFARAAAEAQAPAAPPKAKRSPRRFLLPLIVIGAAAYGAHWGYNYFTEGRFLVSTDDAYAGADTVIVSPKIAGYISNVAVRNNQDVHAGDVLARIDDGDYQLALDAAKDKVATQDATITRIGRQIEAQAAVIAQAQAQVAAADATADSAAADAQRASLEFDRAQKLELTSFGTTSSSRRTPTENAPPRR